LADVSEDLTSSIIKEYLPDYTTLHPRRQPSSGICNLNLSIVDFLHQHAVQNAFASVSYLKRKPKDQNIQTLSLLVFYGCETWSLIPLMMEAEMVSETLGFYPQLTRLVIREDFIEFSHRESFKSYLVSHAKRNLTIPCCIITLHVRSALSQTDIRLFCMKFEVSTVVKVSDCYHLHWDTV
jgi:hypothetical protein